LKEEGRVEKRKLTRTRKINSLYNEYTPTERFISASSPQTHSSPSTSSVPGDFLFPLVLHPDTSGMAHIIGMIDRMIGWLKTQGEHGEVEFCRYEDVAREWRGLQRLG